MAHPRLLWALLALASPAIADLVPAFGQVPVPLLSGPAAEVVLDGRLDDAVWQQVPGHDQFRVIEPDTLAQPRWATRVHLWQTADGLYVGMVGQQPPDTVVSRLSSRDTFRVARDDFSVTLDASGDGRYAYWFTVHAGGSLSDGTVLPERRFSSNWDGPWRGASATLDDGWSAEFFLPWKMMAMPAVRGDRAMGIYVSRRVAELGQRWSWPTLPETRPVFLSALQPLALGNVQPSQQLTFYPYASSTVDTVGDELRFKAGGDVFWRPNTNAQMALTLNPDFGQVEQDDVIVNLSAFETFFPEKRLFFLEGQEIFVTTPRADGRRGTPTTLINTRRIGGAPVTRGLPDGVTVPDLELNQPSELVAAGKITGQFDAVRYGVLLAAEDDTKLDAEAPDLTNLQVAGRDFAVLRALWESSGTDGAYHGWGGTATAVLHPELDALVQAVDGHYLSPNGQWKWDGQVMHSRVTSADARSRGVGAFVDGTWTPRQGLTHELSLEAYDDQLDINAFGFLRRNDLVGGRYSWRQVVSDDPRYRRVRTRVVSRQGWNTDGRHVLSGWFVHRNWGFHDLTGGHLELGWLPSRWDDINSDGNGIFRIKDRFRLQGGYESDPNQTWAWDIFSRLEHEELGGHQLVLSGGVTWRPNGRMSVDLGARTTQHNGWLLHQGDGVFSTFRAFEFKPNLDLSVFFGPRQQLKLSAQWVAIRADELQRYRVPERPGGLRRVAADEPSEDFTISRLNLQLRYRWEVAPLSDLFVVYTRNGTLSGTDEGWDGLFRTALEEPVAEQLVIKFRYRLGA